jgi:ParB family chromosome partitioning protein
MVNKPKFSVDNILKSVSQAKETTNALKFKPYQEILPMSEIQPHPENEFAEDDSPADIQDMAENIKQNGLINPLTVNKVDGKYLLLSGECRFRALQLIGYDHVRCTIYTNLSRADELRILYAANLKVRSYSTTQRLRYYEKLKDILTQEKAAGKYDGPIQSQIAEIMGVSDRQVRKYERISENLGDDDKKLMATGEISVDQAYQMAQEKPNQTGHSTNVESTEQNTTGSASGSDVDMSFWEPYLKESILLSGGRRSEILAFYRKQSRTPSEASLFLKKTFGNGGSSGWNYSDGNVGGYDSYGKKFKVEVEKKAKDGAKNIKRYCSEFSWSQIEKIVRQMIMDGTFDVPKPEKLVNHFEQAPDTQQPKVSYQAVSVSKENIAIGNSYTDAWTDLRKLRKIFALSADKKEIADKLHAIIIELNDTMEGAGYRLDSSKAEQD